MKRRTLGGAGLMVAFIAVVASFLAITGGASATEPGGVSCVADTSASLDGGISGRGATFATNAHRFFARGFRDDICGDTVGTRVAAQTAAVFDNNTMVSYNTYAGVATGSGAGLIGAQCRSDAFTGTDIPYANADLAVLSGAPGQSGAQILPSASSSAYSCSLTGSPFNPLSGFPNGSDTAVVSADPGNAATAPMSFPITGASVAVVVNLGGQCSTPVTTLALTHTMLSLLMGGDISLWTDARLRTNGLNANLSTCGTTAVTRIVRRDSSGTTQIIKNYFKNADSTRQLGPPTSCNVGSPGPASEQWGTLALSSNNLFWPGADPTSTATLPADGNPRTYTVDGGCSPLRTGKASGATGLVDAMTGAAGNLACGGCIGYADLADVDTVPTLIKPTVQTATGGPTAQQPPKSGTAANCAFNSLTPPASSSQEGFVGLDLAGDNWATDNPSGNRGDATYKGTGYPICGLTWVIVYQGLNGVGPGNPNSRLNANQRRTAWAYFNYILSDLGQSKMDANKYKSLPAGWLASLRSGFNTYY